MSGIKFANANREMSKHLSTEFYLKTRIQIFQGIDKHYSFKGVYRGGVRAFPPSPPP